ncbi:hypothetical protein M758_2G164200 [Ceratodon purpureus]|nr:hypothetical protein M758_2G164200 [Ceratodon purpureus]
MIVTAALTSSLWCACVNTLIEAHIRVLRCALALGAKLSACLDLTDQKLVLAEWFHVISTSGEPRFSTPEAAGVCVTRHWEFGVWSLRLLSHRRMCFGWAL